MVAKNSATLSRGEIKSLTGLRGLAACYVMIFHFGAGFGPGIVKAITAHGYISVDLFFVLSGFVMSLTYAHRFRQRLDLSAYLLFLYNRLARIYPLYLFAIVVTCVLSQTPTLRNLVANLLLCQAWGVGTSLGGPTWSISTEFFAYLFFPFFVGALVFGRPLWKWVAFALGIAALAYVATRPGAALNQTYADHLWRWGPLDVFGPARPFALIRCVGGFTLGMLSYTLALRLPSTATRATRHGTDALGTAIFALLMWNRSDLLLVLLFIPLVVLLTLEGSLLGRLLSHPFVHWLGVVSYSIYLLHEIVAKLVEAPLRRFLTERHIPAVKAVSDTIAMILVIIAAGITYRWIEKLPQNALRRLIKEKPSVMATEPSSPDALSHDPNP